ncbi:TPA: hypothetical protein JFW14_005077, partial [Salmonella enterica]|nr:hypothetical protein [Salmonella enterica]
MRPSCKYLQVAYAPGAHALWIILLPKKPYMNRLGINQLLYYLTGNLHSMLDSHDI